MINCIFEDGGKGNLRHVVVHCLCLKGNKMLLVKRAPGILEVGKWGFPGGFLDQGEDIKMCAVRELMEETGYEGTVDKLFRINSGERKNDQGRNNVAFEMLMKIGDKTGKPDWEQTDIRWFDLDKIDTEELAFDHGETVELLKKYLKKKFELPLINP